MTEILPLEFSWDGEAMVPANPRRADRQYVIGETYRLLPWEARSRKSHDHFFASVHEAWQNLPERLDGHFPTADHLRKWALIKAGFRTERSIACSSPAEAAKVAAFVEPIDGYAVVVVSDCLVTIYTAESQSYRAMGKKRFGESKTAVLDVLASLIGQDRETLEHESGQAA